MKKILCSLLMLFLFFGLLSAKTIQITENTNQDIMRCTKSDEISTELDFSMSEYNLENVRVGDKEFSKLSIKEEGSFVREGLPELPRVSRIIAIPNAGKVSLEVTDIETQILEDIIIFPHQMDESKFKQGEFVLNDEFYAQDQFFPKGVAELSKPAIMRDLRVVNVTINPFRFNLKTRELSIITNAHVSLTYRKGKGENEIVRNERKMSRAFEPMYRSMILNYHPMSRNSDFQLGSYLFIYPNNSTVETDLQPLLYWKHQKGFEVTAVSTEETGSSSYSIKDYIQDAYDNWENPPEYICLVGDAGGTYNIPTSDYGGGEGDQYYALLDGNDILADANLGRLSFNSLIELQTLVAKTINYEKDPLLSNTEWFTDALLVGDPSPSGYSCISVNRHIKEVIERNEPDFTFHEIYSGSFATEMNNAMNGGVSYFNYRGYLGMSGWGSSHINSLNNGAMLPLGVISTCGTGDFAGTSDCTSEEFVKVGSPGSPKGAIGAVGTATWSTHTTFNNILSAGIFDGIFNKNVYSMGGALNMGKLAVYNSFPGNPADWVKKFAYWNNLMGDPGLELWTNVPEIFDLEFPEEIYVGTNYLEIELLDEFNNPIENALVCAVQDDNEIFAREYSDSEGKVCLPLNASVIGDAVITISKHNYKPFIQEFEIVEATTFAQISSFTMNEDEINPGEEIELDLTLENFGSVSLQDVSAEISSSSEWVELTQSQSDFGYIPSGGTSSSQTPFLFSVSADCPGGTEIHFDIQISDNSGNFWEDDLILPVYSPILLVEEYEVIDSNNDILDPGETANLQISLKNISTMGAINLEAILISPDTVLVITDSIGYFGNISPDEIVTNSSDLFELSASTAIFPGSQFDLQLHLYNSAGYNAVVYFTFAVGEVQEDDPLGPDSYGYYCYDSNDILYSQAPVYNWVEIAPDAGGSGTDLNLYDGEDEGDVESVDLPADFNFRMYGLPYSEITVCSNGWIAGGFTEQTSFMNTPIPGPLGPNPMIAPFWDDLRTSGGQVCVYYNEDDHTYIVEWYQLPNDYNTYYEETFQAIIYDASFYTTPTGDSPILFQYQEIHNVDVGEYSSYHVHHGEYSTVGLEDHTGLAGLQYTFCDEYPAAAHPLEDNLAIFFTTQGSEIVDPPIAHFTPDQLNFQLLPGSTGSDQIEISNTGQSNLIYSINKIYPARSSEDDSRGSGGPDEFGYEWIDSDEASGPDYDWIDIEGIGTEVNFVHNDQGVGPFELDFEFELYGESYTEFIINPNGWIGFEEDCTAYFNYSLPNSDGPRAAIMALWDDLDPIQGGNVYYHCNNERLVVWFDDVIHYPGTYNGTYDFQIIIDKNNVIKFQYRTVEGDLDTNTIGLQNSDATIALEVSFDEDYLHDEMAITLYSPVDWLTCQPTSGIILPDESGTLTVDVDTDNLATGQEYLCELNIFTNDPNNSSLIIPVTMTIDDGELGSVSGIVTLNGGSGNVQDVEIQVGDEITYPNINGEYSLLITPGDYQLTASLIDYEPFSQLISVQANQVTEVMIELNWLNDIGNEPEIPVDFALQQNYPNPYVLHSANPSHTTISYQIPQSSQVQITLYNIKGEKVRTIIDEEQSPGYYDVNWSGNSESEIPLSSGVYFYRLKADDEVIAIKKCMILK